jgi:DNA-binding transcriptional MocR family regulator
VGGARGARRSVEAQQPVVEVASSTRDLAESLNLSKDTVARALRALARAGLARRVDRRSDRTGRFTATTYVVDLCAAGLAVTEPPDVSAAAPPEVVQATSPVSEARRPPSSASQLEHGAARTVAGRARDICSGVERPLDPAGDSEPASSQLSLLS